MNMLTLPRYITHLTVDENTAPIFQNHPEIPLIIDALGRYERNHLLLIGTPSEKINLAVIESMITRLSLSKILPDALFFYFDCHQLQQEENELAQFKEDALNTHKPVIIILNQIEPLLSHKLLQSLLFNKQCRFIVFTEAEKNKQIQPFFSQFNTFFSTIQLTQPHATELFPLLKLHCARLEAFHHVIIPDEIITSALAMTNHYLYSPSLFDKALELLDSSAAHTSALEKSAKSEQFKPVVSNAILIETVSRQTHIPTTHLQNNKFQSKSFQDIIEQQVVGQERAIAFIASVLQQAYIKLNGKQGPLCNLLFVGSSDVGKSTLAHAMANYLFGHDNALIPITLDKNFSSLKDIKITNTTHDSCLTLLEAVAQTPYAIILIDDIRMEHLSVLNLFYNILTNGYIIEQGKKYDFSHTIVIMTTRIGSEPFTHLSRPHQQEQNKTPDLLQLVLNENVLQTPTEIHHALSSQELCDEMMPALEKNFSSAILQKAHLVPFISLDFSALEKVIRLKIKSLAKTLDSRFDIELNYAPETIKFLAHEAYWRKPNKSLEKLLEQLLHSPIAQEIMTSHQNKNRSKRLLLQLNESGHSLRCGFMTEGLRQSFEQPVI